MLTIFLKFSLTSGNVPLDLTYSSHTGLEVDLSATALSPQLSACEIVATVLETCFSLERDIEIHSWSKDFWSDL